MQMEGFKPLRRVMQNCQQSQQAQRAEGGYCKQTCICATCRKQTRYLQQMPLLYKCKPIAIGRGPHLEAELTLTANSSNNTRITGVLSVHGSQVAVPPGIANPCCPRCLMCKPYAYRRLQMLCKGTHTDHNNTTATAVTQVNSMSSNGTLLNRILCHLYRWR